MDRVFSVPSLSENIVQIREYFPDFPEFLRNISQNFLKKSIQNTPKWSIPPEV
jgi:hypothetical protein